MGYTKTNGQWADTDAITPQGATTQTTTGTSTGIELGDKGTARLTLAVTASSGTLPTLDVEMQTSSDNSTWRTLDTFAQATGVSSARVSFAGCDRFIRASWTIAGTLPSFTFSIAGEAV